MADIDLGKMQRLGIRNLHCLQQLHWGSYFYPQNRCFSFCVDLLENAKERGVD